MVHKKLVFHFYVNDGWENNFANNIHFRCLERYSGIFNESLIVIAFDPENEKLVPEVKKKFIDCIKSETLAFKTILNDAYFEGGTFKREIVDRAKEIDGLVFFGHNKGVSCLSTNGAYDEKSLAIWICGLYFYSLEFYEEVEHKLCAIPAKTISGAFLMGGDFIRNAAHVWYSGTMYWINPGRILKFNQGIPALQDREYAEWFPGEVFGEDITYVLTSRNDLILYDVNLYFFANESYRAWAKCEEDTEKFKIFFENINGYAL